MRTLPGARKKLVEWVRRYLPCEIAGTVAELGCAAVAYLLTDSLAAAAVAGTVGAAGGYYAVAYATALRWSYLNSQRRWPMRLIVANVLALRSVAVEFGPAEAVDSGVVRPLAYYAGPYLLGNAVVGWIAAKVFSDIVFYVCAVFSYERCKAVVARRPEEEEEDYHGPDTAAAAA